jgi:hypothetical protein
MSTYHWPQGLKAATSARSPRITINNLLDVPLRRAECSIMCASGTDCG